MLQLEGDDDMVRVVLFLGLTAVSAYHPAVPASRIALRRSTVRHLFDAKGNPIAPTTPPAGGGAENQDHEVTLGELIFSSRDPRLDVATTPELYGDDFCAFVEGKADDSEDMEERVALKSLVEMVRDTHKAIENARKDAEEIERRMMAAANGEDEDAPAAAASDASVDVLAAARAATLGDVYEGGDAGPAIDVGPTEAGLSGEALRTYDALLTSLVAAAADGNVASAVEGAFERCDYSLLTLASERQQAGGDDAEALAAVIDAVNGLAAKRLEQAAARLGSVLKAGDPSKMMAKITELAVSGGVDTQLVELLEANRQQAAAAGPAGAQAAELMKNLASRCRDEMDKRETGPEIRLLRALLRSDDEDTRKQLLVRAFEPKEAIALGFGDDAATTAEGVEVEPPKFIDACLKLIADFGNIDDNGAPLADRVRAIAAQAEKVATELFGDCDSPRALQDKMWNEATTSVFDLEAVEMAAEAQGENVPWSDDRYDDMLPEGWDHAGPGGQIKKSIGGG